MPISLVCDIVVLNLLFELSRIVFVVGLVSIACAFVNDCNEVVIHLSLFAVPSKESLLLFSFLSLSYVALRRCSVENSQSFFFIRSFTLFILSSFDFNSLSSTVCLSFVCR